VNAVIIVFNQEAITLKGINLVNRKN